MIAPPGGASSRMMLAVPLALCVAEMKIQPSLDRVNENEPPGFEIEETTSNSETRLFSFFSPVKTTFASAAAATSQTNEDSRIEAIRVSLMAGSPFFVTDPSFTPAFPDEFRLDCITIRGLY